MEQSNKNIIAKWQSPGIAGVGVQQLYLRNRSTINIWCRQGVLDHIPKSPKMLGSKNGIWPQFEYMDLLLVYKQVSGQNETRRYY